MHPSCGKRIYSLICILGMLCGGCAVGPDFEKPKVPSVTQFTRDAGEHVRAESPTLPSRWWESFGSPELNELVKRAFANNPTIMIAQAALRQAHENTAAQFGSYFPQIAGSYSASRQKNAVGTLSPTLTSGDPLYTLHTVQLNVSYSPDVFGLNRRQVEALHAQEEIQRYQLYAVYQTLAANVVATLVQHAALVDQVRGTEDIIQTDEHALRTLRKQQELGYASALDVATQETALAQARQILPPLQKQLEQTRDLMAVLLGVVPANLPKLNISLDAIRLQRDIPLTLPSELLARRPDIQAAQAQLHAATAQVGVAIANRLPQLSIAASDGGSSTQFSSMFADGNKFWSLTGGLVQPIWDFGVLKHHQAAAEAALDQAKAQYQNTVLLAFQNVADCLYAIKHDAQSEDAAKYADGVAKHTLDLTRRQAELGAVNSLAVFAMQQAYIQSHVNAIQAKAMRFLDVIALYQALGGSVVE